MGFQGLLGLIQCELYVRTFFRVTLYFQLQKKSFPFFLFRTKRNKQLHQNRALRTSGSNNNSNNNNTNTNTDGSNNGTNGSNSRGIIEIFLRTCEATLFFLAFCRTKHYSFCITTALHGCQTFGAATFCHRRSFPNLHLKLKKDIELLIEASNAMDCSHFKVFLLVVVPSYTADISIKYV